MARSTVRGMEAMIMKLERPLRRVELDLWGMRVI